jgi:5-methylcytosine-specific restriction endonuclease McrA
MISELMKSKLYSRFDKKGYCKGIKWEQIETYYKIKDKNKLHCAYCGKELKEIDNPPYRDIVSVDRIKPICNGGQNTFENMTITCAECNIVKGTMSLETFLEMKNCLENCGIKEKVFKEIYRGRKAAMLKRKVELWELV